jgi:phosphate transport system substrate-binding protein
MSRRILKGVLFMKRFASLLFALALALPATFACAAEFDGTLTLMGSSTLGPVISQVAKTLADEKKTWNAVDPSLPAVPIKIVVAGSGSGEGIKAVVENSANFGSSRARSRRRKRPPSTD